MEGAKCFFLLETTPGGAASRLASTLCYVYRIIILCDIYLASQDTPGWLASGL